MSVVEIVIVISFFTILIGSGIYIFFKNEKCKCDKLNVFGNKPANDTYQNWDGSNPDMPVLVI
tara:strand:- start:615 stop:803 length:189 start_codon:yes stop_codon:yes gene_type:complete